MGHEMDSAIGATQLRIAADLSALQQPEIITAPFDPMGAAAAGTASSFSASLAQMLHGVDDQQRVADEKMAAVDSGESDDLVGAMLSSQEANLSFSMLMQVRNKIAGAMDDLIKLSL